MMPIFKLYSYTPNSVNDYNLFFNFMHKETLRPEVADELSDSFSNQKIWTLQK